jgi:hypothetical protein
VILDKTNFLLKVCQQVPNVLLEMGYLSFNDFSSRDFVLSVLFYHFEVLCKIGKVCSNCISFKHLKNDFVSVPLASGHSELAQFLHGHIVLVHVGLHLLQGQPPWQHPLHHRQPEHPDRRQEIGRGRFGLVRPSRPQSVRFARLGDGVRELRDGSRRRRVSG